MLTREIEEFFKKITATKSIANIDRIDLRAKVTIFDGHQKLDTFPSVRIYISIRDDARLDMFWEEINDIEIPHRGENEGYIYRENYTLRGSYRLCERYAVESSIDGKELTFFTNEINTPNLKLVLSNYTDVKF